MNKQSLRAMMTPMPHAVGIDEAVASAWRRMHTLGVHHLPVTDEDKVVGILSDRELRLLCETAASDRLAVCIGDVMAPDPCILGIDETFVMAVKIMTERGADCGVVVDDGHLVGILTATDAMRALLRLLSGDVDLGRCALRPSEVRSRILGEHAVLRAMYRQIEESARSLSQGDEESAGSLRERCRELYPTLLRHIEIENTILVPALLDTVAFSRVLVDQLLREHEKQRQTLLAASIALDTRSPAALARDIVVFIEALRVDMEHEEQTLLDRYLLRDDLIDGDAATG